MRGLRACILLAAPVLALLASGCRGPRRPAPPVPPPEAPAPAAGKIAAVWTPASPEGLLETAEFLEAHPSLRLTAVLPERFFSDEEKSLRAAQVLARLAARRQLEPVLALAGDPPLALIMDTELARPATGHAPALPPRFSWPDDVVGHIAQAQSQFRRRWRQEPRGLALPGGAFSGPEFVLIEKMKLPWVLLLEAGDEAGVFQGLPVRAVRPDTLPAEGREAWARAWRRRAWPPEEASGAPRFLPPVRVFAGAELAALASAAGTEPPWVTVSELLAAPAEWPAWSGHEAGRDFSPWIGEPEENLAWRLLGMTRQAVEDFKNSGRADVRTLDLALREIYAAESSRYFLHFGNDVNAPDDADLEREFLAGLAQVFRLMGQPVPQALFSNLADTPWQDRAEDTGGSSFFRSQNVLRWTDPAKDDRGPGDYFYPSAPEVVPGSWDAVGFEVRIHEKTVVFQFEMTALSNPWRKPGPFSGLLADVYMDINRIPGAGSQALLPGRKGIVEKQNAWEYALSVDGAGGRLFQYSPGAPPRVMATLPVRQSGSGAFRVDVPRQHLRGDPNAWGYGVVIMGEDGASSPAGAPMRVLPEPGARHFGGAWQDTVQASSGREAPPFIDLLTPPGVSQGQVLGVYKSGRDVVIPFVRAE